MPFTPSSAGRLVLYLFPSCGVDILALISGRNTFHITRQIQAGERQACA